MTFLAWWGPVFVVMGLIFTFSAIPDPGSIPGGMSDKSAHFLAYAALGAALTRALVAGRASALTPGRMLAAACLATLYGITDEVHQAFVPGRTPDGLDVLADACGAAAGVIGMAAATRVLWWIRLRRGTPAASD